MKIKAKSGMTLVEVVVASTIFMIFCAGFYAAYITALRTHKTAGEHFRATMIARNRIQRALSFDFSSIHLMSENKVPVDKEGNPTANGPYYRTTTVTTNIAPSLAKMVVEVYFPSRSTNPIPVKVSTLITDKI